MFRLAVSYLLVLCILAPSSQADALTREWAGIKGDDDRRYVAANLFPWSAIGRLRKPDGSICTGALVAAAVVVTAAHCLWDEAADGWIDAVDLTFTTAVGSFAERSSFATSYDISSRYRGHGDLSLTNSAHDWALLHLDKALGEATGTLGLLPLDTASMARLADEEPLVMQAGFSADRPDDLTAHIGCRILGWGAPGLLAHDCDALRGDSGSPVFAWVDGAFRILGVHVSTFREGRPGVYGGAVPGAVIVPSARRVGATPFGSEGLSHRDTEAPRKE